MLYATSDERYKALTGDTFELLRDINRNESFSRAITKVTSFGIGRSRDVIQSRYQRNGGKINVQTPAHESPPHTPSI
tara:strand:- start:180 stop:410 length:231 start_codon:yes stop_codon:yes gene_type:complete